MNFLNDIYQNILGIINLEQFRVIFFIILVIMLFVVLINGAKLKKNIKKYNSLMKKLGNGNNLDTMIRNYVEKVDKIEVKNAEVLEYCKKLDNKIVKCIQKVGMVRYNAFEDTGSDLCFVVALLDYEDSGVVINGIYSREGSATYAKPIEKGTSKYTLSIEEVQAIDIAKRNAGLYFAAV